MNRLIYNTLLFKYKLLLMFPIFINLFYTESCTHLSSNAISHYYVYITSVAFFVIIQDLIKAKNSSRDFNDMRKMTDIVQVPL